MSHVYIDIYLYINYVSFCVLLSVHVLSTHAAAVKTCQDQSHGVHLYASCHPKPAMTYVHDLVSFVEPVTLVQGVTL